MTAQNQLLKAPPYKVEEALRALGANLRTARIRRNMTIEDAAGRIGTGIRAVTDAEKGKPSTGIVVYTALLWLYDLMEPLHDLANPSTDHEGLALQSAKDRVRARKSKGLDRDF